MEALVGSLAALILGQAGVFWYKLGKVERGLADLCREVHNGKKRKGAK